MEGLRPLVWMGSTRRDLVDFPESVRQVMGFALFQAQAGEKHPHAKVIKGFGGRGVLEVVERHDGDAYRAVYTVRFRRAVYVLHCFQKKSKRGVATPQADLDLIRSRLASAADVDSKGDAT